jgi:ATP-dependent Zn protease
MPEEKQDNFQYTEMDWQVHKQKIRWLYSGVSIFALIIIAFFILAVKYNFTNYSWNKSQEDMIVKNIQNDLGKYIETEKVEAEKVEARELAKEKLTEIVNNLKITTTTVTGTISTTTEKN